MKNGDAYIKTYALALLATPNLYTPAKALELARAAWAERVENERIIDELLKEGK